MLTSCYKILIQGFLSASIEHLKDAKKGCLSIKKVIIVSMSINILPYHKGNGISLRCTSVLSDLFYRHWFSKYIL